MYLYLSPLCLCVRWQDREISRSHTNSFELNRGLPVIESLCRELDKAADVNATHACQIEQQVISVIILQDEWWFC